MLRALVLALAFILSFPPVVRADPDEELRICMCKQAMARMICKNPNYFQYIGKKGPSTFVFNVFYASKNSNFLCTVTEDFIHITSPVWLRAQQSVHYVMNPETKCATGQVFNPECGMPQEFKCCRKKTPEEALREKDDAFWEKNVPDNLPPPPGSGGASAGVAANSSQVQ